MDTWKEKTTIKKSQTRINKLNKHENAQRHRQLSCHVGDEHQI
jgi:hypothetical protein